MEIKTNVLLPQLAEIFDGNNQGYVADRKCIFQEEFEKVVAVENEKAIGYAVLYFGKDFLEKEKFPLQMTFEKDLVYVWHCITKSGCENQGVQSAIFAYIFSKHQDKDIFSVVDKNNEKSLHLHQKFSFKPVADFQTEKNGQRKSYFLLKKEKAL